jgi:fatty acid desaturase
MEKKIDWYRTPLDKELLRRLTVRSDARGLLQAGSFLLIFAATVWLCLFFFLRRLWLPMAAACYLHCLFYSFIGMQSAVHELSHFTPFKSKWLNEIFYHLFCFLTWNNPVHFRASHMLHHQYTMHRGLDKEVIAEKLTFSRLDAISWFVFDFRWFKQLLLPTIAHFFGRADVDFFFWDPLFPVGDERRGRMCAWARIILLGHLALIALFIALKLWVLIGVVSFGYFFATALGRRATLQQHTGLCPNVPDWRVSCHTVRFGPLTRFLYWNMNYHTEHHMYAAVPFFRLPRLHAALAGDSPAPPRGFLAGWRRVLTIRERQRREPGWCFVPEFPPTAAPPRLRP